MLLIEYPEPDFSIREEGNKRSIYDPIRRKWLLLTPEEWVRQNFISYLVKIKGYPASLIALEKTIRVGELNKRFDILVYDRDHKPWIMIECKAPDVILNKPVLYQVLRYHITVPAGFIVITNGDQAYGWEKREQRFELINELPSWQTL